MFVFFYSIFGTRKFEMPIFMWADTQISSRFFCIYGCQLVHVRFSFQIFGKKIPEKPTCIHKKNYQYTSLTMRDLNAFHSRYYKNKDKRSQDAFIMKHIKGSYTSRRRPRQGNRKGKELTTKYYIYSRSSKKMIRVCQKTFINILDIKRYRVERISKNFLKEGLMPEDNRGGDRKSHKYLGKKTAIIEFIKKLKCSEPHYCRGSSARLYLAAELSINKLFIYILQWPSRRATKS